MNFHSVHVEESVLSELKAQFLREVATNEDKYDSRDIDLLNTDEWYVRRFAVVQQVDHKRKVAADIVSHALTEMKRVYAWRKENRVLDIYLAGPAAVVPREVFQSAEVMPWGFDCEGRLTVFNLVRSFAPVVDNDVVTGVSVWLYEALDRECTKRRCMLQTVNDLRGLGRKNITISASKANNELINAICIGHISRNIMVGIPMLLKPVISAVMACMTGEAARCNVNEPVESILKLMGGNVPPYMQASPTKGSIFVPLGCKSVDEFVKSGKPSYKMSAKERDEYKAIKAPVIKEFLDANLVKELNGSSTDDYLKAVLNR